MGDDICYIVEFKLDWSLTAEHKSFLEAFSKEEHLPGEEGKPIREARSGRPCPYCKRTPMADGSAHRLIASFSKQKRNAGAQN